MGYANQTIVIVGAGLAGVSIASGLRSSGFEGKVVLVSEETELPYDRPPLSKQFLLDGNDQSIRIGEDLTRNVELVCGHGVEAIDCGDRRVRLSNGTTLSWDKLVIATGAIPRRLAVPTSGSPPILLLRTLDDARRIRERLVAGANLLVVGGGPIGLELATTANKLGVTVTVVEAAPRVMARCAPSCLAEFLARYHAQRGIDVKLGRHVIRVGADMRVELDDGARLHADLMVVGIGVYVNDSLATAAGMATCDGIFVDAYGRTTAPGVYAVGDVTRQLNPVSNNFERIETWSNAHDQGLAVARGIADPNAALRYSAVPWYWSDQDELRIQAAGLPTGDDEILRGDPESGRFVALQLRRGIIVGVTAVNSPRDFGLFRRLIAAKAQLARDVLSDLATDLRSLVNQTETREKEIQEINK